MDVKSLDDLYIAAVRAIPRHNVSQLCRLLGISRSTWYDWTNYRATGHFPEPDHLARVANVAGISPRSAALAWMVAKSKDPDAARAFSQSAA